MIEGNYQNQGTDYKNELYTLKSLSLNLPVKSALTNFDNLKLSLTYKNTDLPKPEKLFSLEDLTLPSPDKLFTHVKNVQTPEGKKISDGVWYSTDLKTNDGGKVHLLTIEPDKVDLKVEFNESGKTISPSRFKNSNDFIAAINGQFFADRGTIGDIKSENKVYKDENIGHDYDSASDKRFFIAVGKDNRLLTGKGGISENGDSENFKMFLGGMGQLYNHEQLSSLDKDIKSGNLLKRVGFSGASPNDTISRSFLGITEDGKLLLLAAGEGANRNKGVNFVQAAELMKKLGAVEAFILDGGGSTSMLVKGEKSANTDGRGVKSYISINSKT
jgi:exopolysaccharide biosynthesis protein